MLGRRLARLGGGDGGAFLLEPGQRGAGVGGKLVLAGEIGGELGEALIGRRARLGDTALLFVERLPRQDQALQLGAGGGLRLAQRRQLGGGGFARALGGERGGGVIGDGALGRGEALRRRGELGDGGLPGDVQQHGLGAADMLGEAAVALRLAGLLAQRVELGLQRAQHVVEPRQIDLGALQAQLGLVAARMQPGDPGRLFQQAAALDRLGVDDGADAALAHQRRRMRAARLVGEEQLHVARAHLAAVDAVARAGAALDAARHLDLVILVVVAGRVAPRVVEMKRHFGDVARRPRRSAAEDDVVHLAAAHALGRVLAHHPAQRLDQIRFAAAIGADDPGQAGLDRELGRIDEGLEAAEAELREMHG